MKKFFSLKQLPHTAFALLLSTPLLCSQPQYFYEFDPADPQDPWQQRLEISEQFYSGKTEFQDIAVFENSDFGRVLALDNIIQTTEADEFIYHEMLVQLPMLAHGNPKSVLIIGGGDGGSLREVLRHQSVEKVTMIELDKQVLDICKMHLPMLSQGAFDDKRATILFQDGIDFVKNTQEKYDIIICDTTDPFGPGEVLFSQQFYSSCKNALNKGGILVAQNDVPFTNGPSLTSSYQTLSQNFSDVRFYVAPVPSYVGGFMAFSFSTDNPEYATISEDILTNRLNTLGYSMKYYTPQIHKAAFVLPQYIKNYLP